MIVADTSALVAIILREPRVDECIAALTVEDVVLLSAGTLVEAERDCGLLFVGNDFSQTM